MTKGDRERLENPKVGTDLRRTVGKRGVSGRQGRKSRKRAKGEDRVRPRFCRTVGVELWRGKGSTVGGGVAGGDRGEHAGSLLKCQENL